MFKTELVQTTQHGDGVGCLNEVGYRCLFELGPVSLLVTLTLPLLDFGLEDLGFVVRRRVREFGEDTASVKELGVEVLGGFVAAADDEDFGGDVSGGGRLGCFDLGEQLIEDPEK